MKLLARNYVFANVADTIHTSFGAFRVQLPDLHTGKNIYNRLYIKKCVIPYNWKRVTANTKTLTIDGVAHNITEGNYNILNLVTELNAVQPHIHIHFNQITSRLSFHNHNSGHDVVFSSTAWEMLGLADSSPITILRTETYEAPNPVDVRPKPVIEIRVDVSTAGQEIIEDPTEGKGQIQNTNILCAIAMDVPIYSHKVWIDDNGLYFANVTNENREIHFTITDTNGNLITPQSSPYFIIGVDTYRDDERELLDVQKEALKLQQYNMLLTHGDQPK